MADVPEMARALIMQDLDRQMVQLMMQRQDALIRYLTMYERAVMQYQQRLLFQHPAHAGSNHPMRHR